MSLIRCFIDMAKKLANGRTAKTRQSGFTLVETIIAIGLFTVIAISAYGGFRNGFLAYQRIEAQLGKNHELNMFLYQFGREIRNAVYYAPYPFEGEADKIRFATWVKRFDGTKVVEDLGVVSYEFRSKDLERVEEKTKKGFKEGSSSKEKMLTLESCKFQFAYRRRDGGIEWKNEWSKKPYQGLPKAIRLLIQEADPKRKTEEKTYQFIIPHGVLTTIK